MTLANLVQEEYEKRRDQKTGKPRRSIENILKYGLNRPKPSIAILEAMFGPEGTG